MEGTCFGWKITFTAFRKVWRVLFQEVIKPFVVEWSFRSLLTELRRLFNPDPIYCEVFLEPQIQLDSTLNDEKRCFNVFPVLATRSRKLNNRRDLARKSVTYKFNIQVPFKAFSSHTVYISIQYPRFGALNKGRTRRILIGAPSQSLLDERHVTTKLMSFVVLRCLKVPNP